MISPSLSTGKGNLLVLLLKKTRRQMNPTKIAMKIMTRTRRLREVIFVILVDKIKMKSQQNVETNETDGDNRDPGGKTGRGKVEESR